MWGLVMETVPFGYSWTCDELKEQYGPEAYLAADVLGRHVNVYVTSDHPVAMPTDVLFLRRMAASLSWDCVHKAELPQDAQRAQKEGRAHE